MHYHKGWICTCNLPCNTAKKRRNTYTYEHMDLRIFPGIQRDSKGGIHHKTMIVKRISNYFQINVCIARRKPRNHTTTRADILFVNIANQLTIIVAYAMNCCQYIRSLKPLVIRKNIQLSYLLKYAQNLMFYVNSEK